MNSKGKLNEWKIIGNAGKDAEVVDLPNGNGRLLVKFSCATAQGFKDEDTLWVNVVQFVNPSTPMGKFQLDVASGVRKGDYLYISGHAKMHSYNKNDGSKGVDLSIDADSVIVLRQAGSAPNARRSAPSADIPEELGGNDGFENEEGPLF